MPLPYPCPPERDLVVLGAPRTRRHEPQGPAGGDGWSRRWLLLLLPPLLLLLFLLAAWHLTPFALQGPSHRDTAMQDLLFSTCERAEQGHHLPAAEELGAALDGRNVATWLG